MQRTPEPTELMDEPAQAQAYASADFGESNKLFASLLAQMRPYGLVGKFLDLGCGPADIPFALLHDHPKLRIDALDGAESMLALARAKLQRQPQLGSRLHLMQHFLPCTQLQPRSYDGVISNSLLHHVSDPDDLWQTVHHCARHGAAIVVMDLARPLSPLAVDSLVRTYTSNESPVLRADFRASLYAAYRVDEVKQQLRSNALDYLQTEMVSDRHWAVRGTYRSC